MKQKKKPAPAAPERPLHQRAFLAAYRVTGVISEAARRAEINRASHYDWLEDPAYAAEFADAHEEACDYLESEARRRAVEGWEEPVIYKGQPSMTPVLDSDGKLVLNDDGEVIYKPLTVVKKDSNILMLLLKAARPDKYRDNFRGEITTNKVRTQLDLSNLTDEELETLHEFARKAFEPKRNPGGEGEEGET